MFHLWESGCRVKNIDMKKTVMASLDIKFLYTNICITKYLDLLENDIKN